MALARVEGGRREGHAVSNDGTLDIELRRPRELGDQCVGLTLSNFLLVWTLHVYL